MATVRFYSKSWCGYCHRAKDLLRLKGVPFEEIDVTHDREGEAEMIRLTGRHTVPQIFIGDHHVGGYDDLARLDARGELDPLLGL